MVGRASCCLWRKTGARQNTSVESHFVSPEPFPKDAGHGELRMGMKTGGSRAYSLKSLAWREEGRRAVTRGKAGVGGR